ncbi:MAG TPA: flavin reductase family protein [Bacteroidota bacterium]|nr:flavin reductase family protein [Bacteroidota bacterium]
MNIIPSAHDARLVYRLMTGLIVPRPIAFVSTLSADGIRNLAPFSFFTAISANPPVACFAPMVRGSDGTTKDTLHNIEATGEFVINVVSEEIAEQMNATSAEFPPEVDEFGISGLTPVESTLVRAPRVKEAKASMECRLFEIVTVSRKPLGGSLVLGEIVCFHVEDSLFHDFSVDPAGLRAFGRMGGSTYSRTTDRFELQRPTVSKKAH